LQKSFPSSNHSLIFGMLSSFGGCVGNGRVVRCHTSDATVLAMTTGEQLCVVGAAELTVASGGCVEVLGHLAWPGDARLLLVSPPWEAALCLVALPKGAAPEALPTGNGGVSGCDGSGGGGSGGGGGGGGPGGSSEAAGAVVEPTSGPLPLDEVVASVQAAHPNAVVLVLWDLHEPATWLEGYAFAGGGAVEEQLSEDVGVPGLRVLYVVLPLPSLGWGAPGRACAAVSLCQARCVLCA
jgi:hypothetical protein